MKICSQCGLENDDAGVRCASCNTEFNQVAAAEAALIDAGVRPSSAAATEESAHEPEFSTPPLPAEFVAPEDGRTPLSSAVERPPPPLLGSPNFDRIDWLSFGTSTAVALAIYLFT